MILINYLIHEFGRILLKKGHKNHSDLVRGLELYQNCPRHLKSRLQNVFLKSINYAVTGMLFLIHIFVLGCF